MGEMAYFDYAATTPVDPRVLEAMLPFFTTGWGNPSSIYAHARRARRALDESRDAVARVLRCRASEVVFTGGGTESDNLAVKGAALAQAELRGWRHVVTSAVEHHAVLHACEWLARHFDFEVTYVPVDRYGQVSPDDVRTAVRPDTALVSVMYANNEVGTLQPIAEIARSVRAVNAKTVIHTDAVQAAGLLPLEVDGLDVDLLALSGHKVYAPKGVGALYARRGTPLVRLQSGGGQERELRAGTENVPGIVGLAHALDLATHERAQRTAQVVRLRDRLVAEVVARVPGARLTGHPEDRMPNSASFTIEGADGESLLVGLDQAGICASSGSACTSGSLEVSHVLRAMGVPTEQARGSLRLTVGTPTTDADVDRLLDALPGVAARARESAPIGAASGAA